MKNVFVQTENATNFITAVKEAEKIENKPVILAFVGQAGRGKTATCRYFAAQEGWVHFETWNENYSVLWFLRDLLKELGLEEDQIPRRTEACANLVLKTLAEISRVIIIDEADDLDMGILNLIRKLANKTFCPFVLVGEKLLQHKIAREQRLWSRTLRLIEFKPISIKDILFFAKQAADIILTAEQAEMIQTESKGDYRPVERCLFHLEELIKVNAPEKITDDLVKAAIKRGFRGK